MSTSYFDGISESEVTNIPNLLFLSLLQNIWIIHILCITDFFNPLGEGITGQVETIKCEDGGLWNLQEKLDVHALSIRSM